MSKATGAPKSSSLSELLQEIPKTLAVPVAGALGAFFLYPFDWFTAFSATVMVLGSMLMAFKATRSRHRALARWPWLTGAILLGCAILPWVAVAPLIGTKPLYLCESSNTDPMGTFIEPITIDGQRVATLLFITDPIRKFAAFQDLSRWLAGRRVRVVRVVTIGQQRYYEMPLISALRRSVPTISSSVEQEEYIKIVYQGLTAGIGVTFINDNVLLGVAVGLTHGPVVASVNRRSGYWQDIVIKTSEPEGFRYAAKLDSALTAVDTGDFSTALALLEDAGIHAPSSLEKARSLTLMAKLTSMLLTDSIGALQALSLYNEAYRTWADVVSRDRTKNEENAPLKQWIKDELTAAFTPYGSAYPDVAKVLGLDPAEIRNAEALRSQQALGKPVLNWAEAFAMRDSVTRRLRRLLRSDNAQTWFDAERERLARLNRESLMDESKHAVLQGPEESRWFAETLTEIYAGGMADDKGSIAAALASAAQGCNEPWRSQFKQFLTVTASTLSWMETVAKDDRAPDELSKSLARSFGLKNTARMFKNVSSAAHSQISPSTPSRFEGLSPSTPWWTREYLDWFLATTWDMVTYSHGKCDVASRECEDEIMRKRAYICSDRSDNHRLFSPGLGLAMWLLSGQPRVDPYWSHAFHFATGTDFALWQGGLSHSSPLRPLR